jgi:hypothetical protein
MADVPCNGRSLGELGLIRAIAFEGLGPDHPAAHTLLEALVPVTEAELAYENAMEASLDRAGQG